MSVSIAENTVLIACTPVVARLRIKPSSGNMPIIVFSISLKISPPVPSVKNPKALVIIPSGPTKKSLIVVTVALKAFLSSGLFCIDLNTIAIAPIPTMPLAILLRRPSSRSLSTMTFEAGVCARATASAIAVSKGRIP